MDFILPIIGGISCKLYDDLNDNHFLTNEIFKESLKGSQWILLTLLSHNDFNFALVNYLINVANAISNWKEWNHGYETSLLILCSIFIPISFSTRKSVSYMDILYIVCFVVAMAVEPLIISEEYSIRKFLHRSLSIISLVSTVCFGLYFNVSISFIKLGLYGIGYFLTSSIFQGYMLIKNNDIPTSRILHG
jgi:hypothetical protein